MTPATAPTYITFVIYRVCRTAFLGCFLLINHNWLRAEHTDALALLDSTAYRQDTQADLDRVERRLEVALVMAKRRLACEAHGGGWADYLQLKEMEERLRSLAHFGLAPDSTAQIGLLDMQTSTENLAFLASALQRFYGPQPGLEMEELVNLRDNLHETTSLYWRLLHPEKARSEFERRKKAVRDIMQSELSASNRFRALDTHVRWLKQHLQLPGFLSFIEKQNHPNFIATIQSYPLVEWSQQTIHRTVPIDKQLKGRTIRGTANVTAGVHWLPIESPTQLAGQVRLNANLDICLVGNQGRMQFRISSSGAAVGKQSLVMEGTTLKLYPAEAHASARLLSATLLTPRNGPIPKVVRRIGLRVIQNQQADIEHSMVSEITESIEAALRDEVTKQLTEWSRNYIGAVLPNLDRLGVSLDPISSSSCESNVILRATVGREGGLTAPTIPPTINKTGWASLQIHESLFNSLFHHALAGREFDDLRHTLSALGIELNKATGIIPGTQGVMGITFSEHSPLNIKLGRSLSGEDQMELRVSGSSYRFDELRLSPMDFVVRFRMRSAGGQLLLDRDGPVDVLPPSSGSSLRFIQQRQIISARLQDLFPETQNFQFRKLIADTIAREFGGIIEPSVEDGWLNLTFLDTAR